MTTGTITIPNVDATVAQNVVTFIKNVASLSGASFTPALAPSFPFNARATFEGDSITRGSNGPTFIQMFNFFSRGRFFFPYGYNQGFGGDTAASMATDAEIALVKATQPAFVVYLSGINDLGGTTDTPATIFANQRKAVTSYGVPVVFVTTLQSIDPRFTANPGREIDRQQLVALQQAQTDVILVNMEGIWNPATMTIDNRTATDTTDVGLHPNYLGALTIGQQIWNAVKPFSTVTEDAITHSFDQTNLMLAADNPQFVGTAGQLLDGATGVAPTGWVLDVTAGSGLSVSGSMTTLNGNNALQITVSGTNKAVEADGKTPANALVTLRNVINFTGDAAGDVYESWWDFTVANSKNLQEIAVAAGQTTDMQVQGVFPNTNYPDGFDFQGVARTSALSPNPKSNTDQPAEIVSPGTLTNINSQFELVWLPGVEVGGTFTIAAPSLRRVPTPH